VRGVKILTLLTVCFFANHRAYTKICFFANVSFIFLYPFFFEVLYPPLRVCSVSRISGSSEIINGAITKINVRTVHFNYSELKIPKERTSTVCWSSLWNAGSFHLSLSLRKRQNFCTQKASMSWKLSCSG